MRKQDLTSMEPIANEKDTEIASADTKIKKMRPTRSTKELPKDQKANQPTRVSCKGNKKSTYQNVANTKETYQVAMDKHAVKFKMVTI